MTRKTRREKAGCDPKELAAPRLCLRVVFCGCESVDGASVRLVLDLVRPAIDSAEFDDIGVSKICERLGCLFAAIAAAAVHEDELVFVGERALCGG